MIYEIMATGQDLNGNLLWDGDTDNREMSSNSVEGVDVGFPGYREDVERMTLAHRKKGRVGETE